MNKKLVVYTDLDGTLLDHHSYSFQAAEAMLSTLKTLDIPVIPNTSKTFAELQKIRQQTKLQDTPFIIENGAAVLIPKGYFPVQPDETDVYEDYWIKSFSNERSYWIALLAEKATRYGGDYKGFSDMSSDEISLATGLSEEDASLANTRQFSEPLRWLGSEETKIDFSRHMKAAGANVLQGGRFVHISGKCNKGMAMRWLTQQMEKQYDSYYQAIALGDSFNGLIITIILFFHLLS